MNDYEINLTTVQKRSLSIPVLPEKLAVSSPGNNKTETVLGLGEVLLLRPKGLRTVSWDSFFPARDGPYVTGTHREPAQLVQAIQNARDSREPVQFQLLRTDLDLNIQMGVDSFSYEERGGEPGDLYYSIKLSEWRNYGASEIDTFHSLEKPPDRDGTPETPKRYTVVSGDSLWAIAKRSYGDGSKWKSIYEANRGTLGANPNLIYPGQVLTLP